MFLISTAPVWTPGIAYDSTYTSLASAVEAASLLVQAGRKGASDFYVHEVSSTARMYITSQTTVVTESIGGNPN